MITLPGRRGLTWQNAMQRPGLIIAAWILLLLALGASVIHREIHAQDTCRTKGGQVVVTSWVNTTCQTPGTTVTTP